MKFLPLFIIGGENRLLILGKMDFRNFYFDQTPSFNRDLAKFGAMFLIIYFSFLFLGFIGIVFLFFFLSILQIFLRFKKIFIIFDTYIRIIIKAYKIK